MVLVKEKWNLLKLMLCFLVSVFLLGLKTNAETFKEEIVSGVPVYKQLTSKDTALYTFTPNERGYVKVVLEPSENADASKVNKYDYTVKLVDSNYNEIRLLGGYGQQHRPQSLVEGEQYTLKVTGRGEPYKLTYTLVKDTAWEIENNDTCKKATPLVEDVTFGGILGDFNDDVDIFSIEVAGKSKLTFSFDIDDGLAQFEDFEIKVIDVDCKKVLAKFDDIADATSGEAMLSGSGKYYISITRDGSQPKSVYRLSYHTEISDYVSPEELGAKKFRTNSDGDVFYQTSTGVVYCYDKVGNQVKNSFKCDGTYTYYFQADGSSMQDRLTYHPDGVHVIYFDKYGHEVFSDYAHISKSIAGDVVDDFCFFDVNGYLYVDVLTYDKAGKHILYANPYGRLECGGWFQFSDTLKWADGTPCQGFAGQLGYADKDCHLVRDKRIVDPNGRSGYLQGNGVFLPDTI